MCFFVCLIVSQNSILIIYIVMTDAFNGTKISFAPSTPSLLRQSKPGDQAADALQTLQWPLALGCLRQIFCSAGCVLLGSMCFLWLMEVSLVQDSGKSFQNDFECSYSRMM